MKNKTLTAIVLSIIPLFLTACTLGDIPLIGKYLGGGGADEGGDTRPVKIPVTLSMWGLWDTPEIMEVLVKEYQVENSMVTINYEDRSVVKPDQYKETVIGRLKEGGAPDIILVHNTWLPYLKDYLSPMPSGMMSAQDYSQKFYPVVTESAVVDGKIYGVPSYYDGLMLVYNKDHFDEIDQDTPPTAWEEFRRIAMSLTIKSDDGKFVRAGAAIGAADNIDFFSDILGLMFAQAGISIPDGLDSKSAQDALSFYLLFLQSDGIWSTTLPEASKAFTSGEVSMIFVPSWNLLDIVRENPSMNIGVAPVPQALVDSPVSWGSFWLYAVPKSSSNSNVAWGFINFITQDGQQSSLFNEASKYRPFGAPSGSVSASAQLSSNPLYEYIRPVIETAPAAKSSYFTARSGNRAEVEALKKAVNSVLSKDATPEEAMKLCKEALMSIPR